MGFDVVSTRSTEEMLQGMGMLEMHQACIVYIEDGGQFSVMKGGRTQVL